MVERKGDVVCIWHFGIWQLGIWHLALGIWHLAFGHLAFGTWAFGVWAFGIGHWALGIGHWVLGTWAFGFAIGVEVATQGVSKPTATSNHTCEFHQNHSQCEKRLAKPIPVVLMDQIAWLSLSQKHNVSLHNL